jgi:sodium-dependent dicarboxylate transporter 2/3/5
MAFGVPAVLLLLPLCAAWLARGLGGTPAATIPALGPWQPAERRVLAVFGLVALAWITRTEPFGGWSTWLGLKGANDAAVALLGVVAMCLVPDAKGGRLLTWDGAERIPWGALVLFGGGIALASAFDASGLSRLIAEDLAAWKELALASPWTLLLLMLAICASVTLLSEIASNTAAAVLLMPILAAAAVAVGVEPALFMVPAVLAASCGFMLPVATAPNLVAYGTRQVTVQRMVREGAVVDVMGVLVLTAVCWVAFAR